MVMLDVTTTFLERYPYFGHLDAILHGIQLMHRVCVVSVVFSLDILGLCMCPVLIEYSKYSNIFELYSNIFDLNMI